MNADKIVRDLRAEAQFQKDRFSRFLLADAMSNAADLIESLQAENKAAIAGQETLQKALAESQRREQAAVENSHHNDACSICVGSSVEIEGCDAECLDCKLNCRCKDCRDKSKWQWRGPQKSEKEDSDA